MKKIRSTFLASLAGMFLLNTALVCAEGAKLVLGTKVDKHVIQNERDHFAFHDGQVWAQIELKPSTDGNVTFVWTRDGHPYSEFKTTTKNSDRFRTQAFVTARPGKWHVAVKSDTNVVLAEKDFIIDGADSAHGMPSVVSEKAKPAETAVKKEKPISGISDALKAINPTETKATEKPADVKTGTKAADKPVDTKTEAKTAEVPADVKTETKAAEKPVDTKEEAKAAEMPVDTKEETKAAEIPADVKLETEATDKSVDAKPETSKA